MQARFTKGYRFDEAAEDATASAGKVETYRSPMEKIESARDGSARVRGLKNVASYTLYSLLCLVLNREAAENIRRPDKAVSPTYFNT